MDCCFVDGSMGCLGWFGIWFSVWFAGSVLLRFDLLRCFWVLVRGVWSVLGCYWFLVTG